MDARKLIYELLQFRRVPARDTAGFGKLSHNRDLCPAFQKKCEAVLNSFEKYRNIVYDVQGPRDEGADVVVRLRGEEQPAYITLQVKSEDDMKRGKVAEKLRGQWFRAEERYPQLLDHYILLCCDALKYKSAIRDVEAAFLRKAQIHVIEPEYALAFLHLGNTQLDAIVKTTASDEDIVFKRALNLAADLAPAEKALLLVLVQRRQDGEGTTVEDLATTNWLTRLYKRIPDCDREYFFADDEDAVDPEYSEPRLERGLDLASRLALDIDYLESWCVSTGESGAIRIEDEAVRPLAVILLDAEVRYGYSGEEALDYMYELLG